MNDTIKCPVCDVDMQTSTVHQIEIDRCPQCKGIWFDILEHEDLKKIDGSAQKIDTPDAEHSSAGKIIDCPRCHIRMSPTHDTQQPHIVYEKCSHCSGVFFDAGEFTDLQNLTLAEKLKSWVM